MNKNVILQVCGGLGNRICPILSLINIQKTLDFNLLLVWTSESFKTKNGEILLNDDSDKIIDSDFFTKIKKSEISNFNNIYKVEIDNYKTINLELLLEKYDNILIYNRWSLINNDINIINKWIPYTKKRQIYVKDKYLEMLNMTTKNITYSKNIIDIVEKNMHIVNNQITLGIHIRGSDNSQTSFYRSDNPDKNDNSYDKLIEICDNFLKDNKNGKIFLITPKRYIEFVMKQKYDDNILTLNYHKKKNYEKDRSEIEGLEFALAELILYSKCKKLIGTAGCSFSFLGWLHSDCKEYETLF